MDNEFILQDRLQKIRQVVGKYGEEKFILSFSGGKDSTVLSALLDIAIPGNNIPRVYADTGIELNMIRDFVYRLAEKDTRVVIIKPEQNIKELLERDGYPFKSKGHSEMLARYQRSGYITSVLQYLGRRPDKAPWSAERSCPKCLEYQFTPDFKIKCSDRCCVKLKERPVQKWQRENKRPYAMVGLMREEGGRRFSAKCLAFKGKRINFQPLVMVSKDWEDWFISKYNVEICDIYKPPYNFHRTGCKGCPFNKNLERELETIEKYFPAERKQCEYIWKPIYDEYRRIGYRLKGDHNI